MLLKRMEDAIVHQPGIWSTLGQSWKAGLKPGYMAGTFLPLGSTGSQAWTLGLSHL